MAAGAGARGEAGRARGRRHSGRRSTGWRYATGEGPTLTVDDLGGFPGPSMVMVGDVDTEIPMEHTLALRDGLRAQLAVVPVNRLVVDSLTEDGTP